YSRYNGEQLTNLTRLESSTTRNRVEIANSLCNSELSDSIQTLLKQIYASLSRDEILTVYVLPAQLQANGVDCGCHAIATAVEFLVEDGDSCTTFDLDQMRQHLVSCLEQENMLPFPRSAKRLRGRNQK